MYMYTCGLNHVRCDHARCDHARCDHVHVYIDVFRKLSCTNFQQGAELTEELKLCTCT